MWPHKENCWRTSKAVDEVRADKDLGLPILIRCADSESRNKLPGEPVALDAPTVDQRLRDYRHVSRIEEPRVEAIDHCLIVNYFRHGFIAICLFVPNHLPYNSR